MDQPDTRDANYGDATEPEGLAPPTDGSWTEPAEKPGDTRPEDADSDEEIATALRFLDPVEGPGSLGALDGYSIRSVLGRGAMGIVLKGYDPALSRLVAIKLLSPTLASSPSFRERFLREARAAAGISHPNVVTIHAVGEHRGLPYLVMEFISGRTLAERIEAGPKLAVVDVLRIGMQVAEGLDAAHRQGLIHRDVKPANLMLEESVERVKITDFGLARAALDRSGLTSLGRVIGTPAYMSPEQVGGGPIDGRSDLFALGCVLTAMVTGHSPFRGKHLVEIIRKVQDVDPPRLSALDPRISEELSDLIARLLAKDPEARLGSAAEVAAALSRALAASNRGSSDTFDSLPATVWKRPDADVSAGGGRDWTRIGTILAAGLLILFALGAVLRLARDSRRTPPAPLPVTAPFASVPSIPSAPTPM